MALIRQDSSAPAILVGYAVAVSAIMWALAIILRGAGLVATSTGQFPTTVFVCIGIGLYLVAVIPALMRRKTGR